MRLVRQALHLHRTCSEHNYPSEERTGPALITELLPPWTVIVTAAAAEGRATLDRGSGSSSPAKRSQALEGSPEPCL